MAGADMPLTAIIMDDSSGLFHSLCLNREIYHIVKGFVKL